MPTLEIGPGAGQATAELLALGASPLIAVEPDPMFAVLLRQRFGCRVEVHEVAFEDAAIPAASVMLAASATAWHWVNQDTGLSSVAAALRPGGWWAVWWTVYHDSTRRDPLFDALHPILSPLPPPPLPGGTRTTSQFAFNRDSRIAELTATRAFANIETDEWHWSLQLDPPSARRLFATFSRIAGLSETKRESVLDQIESVVRDDFGGAVQRPVVTILYTAQRQEIRSL